MCRALNTRLLKRGGIWFLTLGRLNISFSVSKRLNKCFVQEVLPPKYNFDLDQHPFSWSDFEAEMDALIKASKSTEVK